MTTSFYENKKGIHGQPKFVWIPIPTVGLPWHLKLWVTLTTSRRIILTEDWVGRLPTGEQYMLPAGFDSDGTSVPRFLRWLAGQFGISVMAGLPHDFEYRHKNLLKPDGTLLFSEDQTRFQADDRFKRINFAVNDMIIFALIMYMLLRVAGIFAWNQHRAHDGTERNDPSRYANLSLDELWTIANT